MVMNALNTALFSIISLSLILAMTHSFNRIGLPDHFGYWIAFFSGALFTALTIYDRFNPGTGPFD